MDKIRFDSKHQYAISDLASITGNGKKLKVGNKYVDIDALAALKDGSKEDINVATRSINFDKILDELEPDNEDNEIKD